MIKRTQYLKRLHDLKDTNLIKVVTGMRRVGKSTLLAQYRRELEQNGIKKSQIISYNLEQAQYRKYLSEPYQLHDEILSAAKKHAQLYVFIDEVQMLPDFERIIDSLYAQGGIDLYITGSNSYMASSELATLLSGRYIEIEVLPLSFAEYRQFFPKTFDRLQSFEQYLRYGGLPEVANLLAADKVNEVAPYLEMVYETIVTKDVKERLQLSVTDDLRNITLYCFDNIGNITSPNSIANILNVNKSTVQKDLEVLQDCFVLYEAKRFDVRGKKLLATLSKYYTVDVGLANIMLGKFDDADMGRRLENLVYLELRRRYGQVWVGKNYDKEIDFVVRDADGQIEYFQVALTTAYAETMAREVASLKNTGDHYKRTIISLDLFSTSTDGIDRVNAIDWLLNQ